MKSLKHHVLGQKVVEFFHQHKRKSIQEKTKIEGKQIID